MTAAQARLAGAVALLVATTLAVAAAAGENRRMLDAGEAAGYAVGRFDIDGSGFCTGTLISDRLVVTAAHCLYNARTGARMEPQAMRFVLGLHNDEQVAVRAVARAAEAPGFHYNGRPQAETLVADLALLELERPVPDGAVVPVAIGPPPRLDEPLAIVSYARDRSRVASIYGHCPVRALGREVAALNCSVALGGSGGPVFVDSGDGRRLVGVVSASGLGASGMPVTLVVMLEPVLEALRAALGAGSG